MGGVDRIIEYIENLKFTDEDIEFFLVANCDQKIETRGGRFSKSTSA